MLRGVTFGLALTVTLAVVPLRGAQDPEPDAPTFSRDIAPIVYDRCSTCHRPGSAAPFSLLTYRDVSKRARQIALVLRDRSMPPWMPTEGYGEFHEPRNLTEEQLATFLAWIRADCPLGDAEEIPPPPEFSDGWRLGEPDLVLTMPEPYQVPAEGYELWRTFVIPTGLEEDTNLRAIEFRPGNERVVHHFVMYMDRSGNARRADEADPDVGYPGMTAEVELLGEEAYGWVPGMMPHELPPGVATRVAAGTDFVLDTHFLTSGKTEPIQMQVGLYFAEEEPRFFPAGVIVIGPGASIPPGMSDYTLSESFTLPVDAKAMTIAPHAHYVCKSAHVWADLPSGEREELLLIEEWDPNWQEIYRYREPVALPEGTRIEMRFTYDNSSNNPRNPFDPPHRVLTGKASYNEMAIAWLNVIVDDPADLPVLREATNRAYREDAQRANRLLDIWKSLVTLFDADGSGTLDPDEDARATAYVESIWDNERLMLAGFDTDRDGVMSEEEKEFLAMVVRYWNGEPAQ